jgi:hypothetical protein
MPMLPLASSATLACGGAPLKVTVVVLFAPALAATPPLGMPFKIQ